MLIRLAPETVFDRRWALTLLERAWDELRGECESTGKLAMFEQLKSAQTEESQRSSVQHVLHRVSFSGVGIIQ